MASEGSAFHLFPLPSAHNCHSSSRATDAVSVGDEATEERMKGRRDQHGLEAYRLQGLSLVVVEVA